MADRTASQRLTPLLALAILIGLAGPGGADATQADVQLAKGNAALSRSDGVAAEIAFKAALKAGAAKERVAAGIGEALLGQGKGVEARAWLGPAQFSASEQVHGLRMLSRLEIADGNLPQARQALDRVLALGPGNPAVSAEVWVDYAQLLYRSGAQLQSIDAVEKALAADPSNVRALEFRGLMVRDQFGPAAALPWFEAALLRSPNDAVLLGGYAATLGDLGRVKQMLAVTRRMIDIGAAAPRAFFMQAVLAARAGNMPLARAMLNRAGKGLAGVPAAQQLDGVLQLESGNALLAIQSLDPLATSQPQNERAQLLLARAMLAAGQQQKLVDRFADLARRDGAPPNLLLVVGRALEDLGRREEAAGFLDRAAAPMPARLAIVPQYAESLSLRAGDGAGQAAADVRRLLAIGQTGEAMAIAERLGAAATGMSAAQTLLGDARYAAGKYNGAVDAYGQSAKIRYDDALLTRFVLAAAKTGRRDIAATLATQYLRANPQSREAARLAADYAASSGDWQRAVALLEHLRMTGGQRDVRLLSDLAYAQIRSGEAKSAEANAARAWQLQRSSPLAGAVWRTALKAQGRTDPLSKAEAVLAIQPINR